MAVPHKYPTVWRRWLAWRPVRLVSGKLAWCRPVLRRWNPLLADWQYAVPPVPITLGLEPVMPEKTRRRARA